MADSSDQPPSGFWTLTRPSKLSKRRNSDLHELHHKVFNISVVGLSGVEKDKGPIGIGKSCLCNRFVRSASDDYHTDHISVLSQSDFSGRVVNNDHWLYWGSVIKSCDGYDLAFNIIEQSEFVDDSCFQPFKSGKTEPYFKRCANTKLVSAEKLMYICKDQLGIEREYEQRYLPDGKFNVDGFLCLFDVSEVHGRNINKQIEMTNLIMLNLLKTRKPIVFVTTKHDEASEMLVIEAERLINQRDFRGIVPIVETSAQENVNINMAFLVCAQLIDKTRAKLRVPPYYEAYTNHQELLKSASDAYLNLIQSTVHDYNSSWQQVCIKLSNNPEFLQFTYHHGLDKATQVFRDHIKRLRDESISQKVHTYLKLLPDILNELIPKINNNEPSGANSFDKNTTQAWEVAKEQLRSHPLFSKYFLSIPSGISWYDTELLQSTDNRIPSDWLDSDEALSIFYQRNMVLEAEQSKQNSKEMFLRLLSGTEIQVGKPFIELKHVFAKFPSLVILNDQELFEIYVEFQNNLLQQARANFQELLLENAEHLHHLTSSNQVIRQEDIRTINAVLQHDERYQALDRFDQDRTLMMIRHLSFLHSQISEQCPSFPRCVEPEIERLLITKAKNLVSRYFENKQNNKGSSLEQKTCDLVIFGPRRPSQQLILALNVLNSRAPKSSQYQITFTVFDNADEVDSQIQKFKQSSTKPKGCFGIFTNHRSLEHVSYTLEKFLLLSNTSSSEKNHFGNPPVVMLYAADITLDERTMLALENDGQQVADRFKCPFMNVTAIDQYRQHQQNNILTNEQNSTNQVMSECASLDYACVDAAFNVLKEAVSRRVCFIELYNNQDLIPRQAFNPDARILMCLLCGEPFSNELFMWRMFLNFEDCYVTSSKSICLRVKLDNGLEKFIEVIVTSYTHGAFNYKEDLLHGFMLVCSIQRRASISILNAFSFNIPCTPVLVMAVKSDYESVDKAAIRYTEEETKSLIREAQDAANRLKGHFELLNINQEQNSDVENNLYKIRNFLNTVIKRKPMIEKAYELGEDDIALPVSDFEEEYLSSLTNRACADESNGEEKTIFQRTPGSDADILGSNDKNLSDESESYSTILNPGLATSYPKESQPNRSELYSTRPLPPIPSMLNSNEVDKNNLEQLAKTSEVNHKLNLGPKSTQLREDTTAYNDLSSSSEDTEDSANNKQDKPKPGKLDLSQFDNITNAIGKLNVQPQVKESLKSKQSSVEVEEKSQESRFFKSRARKTKNKNIETAKNELGSNNKTVKDEVKVRAGQMSKISNKEFPRSEIKTRLDSLQQPSEVVKQRKSSDELDDMRGVFKEKSNLFKVESSKFESTSASTFLRNSETKSSSEQKEEKKSLPKPAPRSARQLPPPTVSSFATSSSVTTSTSGIKRNNQRLNHGRAVAPPQLPSGIISKVSTTGASDDQACVEETIHKESKRQLNYDDSAIDFSQSPIAQRLLQHSKDYKVCELNSPYESDEESQNLAKGHKLNRGQSLNLENNSSGQIFTNSSIDSSELINSRGAAIRQLNEILANKQPPGCFAGPRQTNNRSSSLDQDVQQAQTNKKNDKDLKKDKKKMRDDEKLEKRRIKEEERIKRQEKKLAAKKSKSSLSVGSGSVGDDGIPLFIRRCIEFIEFEGLDAEGIYRVPGNRAHVDAFVLKFKENPNMSLVESDIPVNAVATALKDFLSKKWGPIIPNALMNELTELSSISEKEKRVEAVRNLVNRLPVSNYKLLKYVFSHFVKVSQNHSLNSMDSKNLAICWWPTLLPLHFSDMVMFEQMRPHLEESIQTMIDQYDFIFDSDEPSSTTN